MDFKGVSRLVGRCSLAWHQIRNNNKKKHFECLAFEIPCSDIQYYPPFEFVSYTIWSRVDIGERRGKKWKLLEFSVFKFPMKQDVNFMTFEAAQIRRSTTTCSSFSRTVVERSSSSWKLILKSFSCNPSGRGGVIRSELFSASSSLDDSLSRVNKQPISDVHCVGRAGKRKKGRETHSFSAFF